MIIDHGRYYRRTMRILSWQREHTRNKTQSDKETQEVNEIAPRGQSWIILSNMVVLK